MRITLDSFTNAIGKWDEALFKLALVEAKVSGVHASVKDTQMNLSESSFQSSAYTSYNFSGMDSGTFEGTITVPIEQLKMSISSCETSLAGVVKVIDDIQTDLATRNEEIINILGTLFEEGSETQSAGVASAGTGVDSTKTSGGKEYVVPTHLDDCVTIKDYAYYASSESGNLNKVLALAIENNWTDDSFKKLLNVYYKSKGKSVDTEQYTEFEQAWMSAFKDKTAQTTKEEESLKTETSYVAVTDVKAQGTPGYYGELTGKTYCGTTNGDFKPIKAGTDMAGGAQGAVYPDEQTQEYLYRLCTRTGADYPLMLGIWISESTASTSSSSNGKTMGLTYQPLIDIVNSGVAGSYKNNYKDEITKVIDEEYRNVYGQTYKEANGGYDLGNIEVDMAYAILELQYMAPNYKAGGSCDVNNTYQSFNNYIAASKGGLTRALDYASTIREELNWDSMSKSDYIEAMQGYNLEQTFTTKVSF